MDTEAEPSLQQMVKLHVMSGCPAIQDMMKEMGDTFDAYEICFSKPGQGPLYTYAAGDKFPPHTGCPVFTGIIKCVEAECGLALKGDVDIRFMDEQ